MKYILSLICILAHTTMPASAQDSGWACRDNHRGPVCTTSDGERWRGRFDHRGQRVWLNSHGDRITEKALPRAGGGNGLYVGNTKVGTHNTNAVGREYFELVGDKLLWCKTNHQGQKTCRK